MLKSKSLKHWGAPRGELRLVECVFQENSTSALVAFLNLKTL